MIAADQAWSESRGPAASTAVELAEAPRPARLRLLVSLARSFGGVLLLGSPASGIFLFAAIAVEPQHLPGAIAGLLIAFLCLRAFGINDVYRSFSVQANAILAGLAGAWLTAPSYLPLYVGLALIAASAAFASILAAALTRALQASPAPPLSAAFTLVFGALLTLLPQLANGAVLAEDVWPYPVGFIGWIDAFLRSMGMIVFSPRPETGILVLCAILSSSGLLLLHGLIGWIACVITSIVLAKFGFTWLWLLSAHNGFVAGMLLGAVFHLPGRAALSASALAGCSAAVLALIVQTGFVGTAWAFQPLPALLTIWAALLALSGRQGDHPLVSNRRLDLSPHHSWRVWRLATARFGEPQPVVYVPVAGASVITQSFDGQLSHRGLWRHGLDFEYVPEASQCSIFGEKVYCPASGVIESVCADVPDNRVGAANYSQNWGNHILLRMDQGGWLMLAHLAQYSVTVSPGQRVRIGEALAAVGNSGRSPVPHLHLHVQGAPAIGSPTMPFRLANYVAEIGASRFWVGSGTPAEGTRVSAALATPPAFSALASLAPGSALWRISTEGNMPSRYARMPASERLTTTLDSSGSQVISDNAGGSLKLHADLDALRLMDYRPGGKLLGLLAQIMSVIPYHANAGLVWRDYAHLSPGGLFSFWSAFIAPYRNWCPTPLQLKCLETAETSGGEVLVEAQTMQRVSSEPIRIVARFGAVKGPTGIEARFRGWLNQRRACWI